MLYIFIFYERGEQLMIRRLYTQVDEDIMDAIEEYYKCHYTIKETASKFGFSYGQINTQFYKFKLKRIKKYDRKQLSIGGEKHVAHSITA